MISKTFVGRDTSGGLLSLCTDRGTERRLRVAGGGDEEAAGRWAGLAAVVLLLSGTFGVSMAYGMLLLLPLYVQQLGGNEANFGVVLSAATVTTVLCIGLHGLVAAGASFVTGMWTPLVAVGVLLGTACAVVYTATPMVMSEMVTDEGRATYFGYLTGTQQVGIGAGPVVARVLVESDLGFRGMFLA